MYVYWLLGMIGGVTAATPQSVQELERKVLLDLLSSTGSSNWSSASKYPSSFVQTEILPLLLGGGIVAGASALIGKIPNLSHKDRRRSKDSMGPCQSTNPLDTTDPDCSALRWNTMVSYFPHDTELVGWDTKIVQAGSQTEALEQGTYDAITLNAQQVFGLDGDIGKPSTSNGIVYQVNVTSVGADQLQRASIAGASAMYDSVANMTQNAINDTAGLKTNLAKGFADLMAQVTKMANNQANLTQNNFAKMNSAATAALSDNVNNVVVAQNKTLADLSKASGNVSGQFTNLTKSVDTLSTTLSDAADSLSDVGESMTAEVATVGSQGDDNISKSSNAIQANAVTVSASTTSKLSALSDTFRNVTESAISQSSDSLKNASNAAIDQAQSTVQSSTDSMQILLVQNVSSIMTQSSANVTNSLSEAKTNVQSTLNDTTVVAKDLAQSVDGTSQTVNDGVANVTTTTQNLSGSIDSLHAKLIQSVTALLTSSNSMSEGSLNSLISALSSSQSDSMSGLSSTQSALIQSISQLLQDNGASGISSSQQISDLLTEIANTKSDASGQIQSSISDVSASMQGKQLDLMNSVSDGLGAAINGLSDTGNTLSAAVSSNMTSALSDASDSFASLMSVQGQQYRDMYQQVLSGSDKTYRSLLDQSSAMDSAQHDLVSSVDSNDNGTSIVQSNMNAYLAGSKAQLATLMGLQGSQMDGFADMLERAANGSIQAVNSAGGGSVNTGQLSLLSSDTQQSLSSRQSAVDRFTDQAETVEQQHIDSTDRLRDQTRTLSDSASDLSNSNGLRLNQTMDGFLNGLTPTGGIVTSDMINLPLSSNDLVSGSNSYVTDFVSRRKAQMSNDVADQKGKITVAQNQANAALAQFRLVAQGQTALADSNNRNELTQKLNALNTSLIDGSVFEEMGDDLSSLQSTTQEGLRNVSSAIHDELDKIPLQIGENFKQLLSTFTVQSADLSDSIMVAQKELGSATTEEEKSAADRALTVLSKLQSMQAGALAADSQLRNSIGNHSAWAAANSTMVSDAISGVLGGINALKGEMSVNQNSASNNTELTSKSVAKLFNGVALLSGGSVDGLSAVAAQKALNSTQLLVASSMGKKANADVLSSAIGSTGSSLMQQTDRVRTQQNESHETVGNLTVVARSTQNVVQDVIDEITRNLKNASNSVLSAVSGQDEQLWIKLAFARSAMGSFLEAWNELAMRSDQQLDRFKQNAEADLQGSRVLMKNALIGGEQQIARERTAVDSLRAEIDVGLQVESEFEKNWIELMAKTQNGLDVENSQIQSDTALIAESIGSVQEEARNTSVLSNQLRQLEITGLSNLELANS